MSYKMEWMIVCLQDNVYCIKMSISGLHSLEVIGRGSGQEGPKNVSSLAEAKRKRNEDSHGRKETEGKFSLRSLAGVPSQGCVSSKDASNDLKLCQSTVDVL